MRARAERGQAPEPACSGPAATAMVLHGAAFRYRAYGLAIGSDMPLRLPLDSDESGATADLVLRHWPNFEGLLAGQGIRRDFDAPMQHMLMPGGQLYIRWSHWCEILVSPDGSQVQYALLEDSAQRFLEPYLTSLAVSAALLQRGEEPLHATCVTVKDRTIALFGDSGMGKSTLASYLVAKGARLLSDDVLRIDFVAGRPVVYPGPARLKLRSDSVRQCLPKTRATGQWNPASQKLIYDVSDSHYEGGPVPLDAIYNLRLLEGATPHVQCVALQGAEKFSAICAATMNALLETPDRMRRQFRFAERLTQAAPVYDLYFPRDYAALDQVAAAICEDGA